MKTILALTALASTIAILGPTQAQATTISRAWYCYASSPSGSGWSTSPSRVAAVQRALAECARRTPRNQTCTIRYCR
jgi:hypothetical protein